MNHNLKQNEPRVDLHLISRVLFLRNN